MIVMIVCHYDSTNPVGGLEKQTRLLASRLRKNGQRVVILSSTRWLSRAKWSKDQGVPVRLFWTYASPQVSGRYMPASLIWAIQLIIWIARNRSKIEIIHCHQIRIHAFVAALAKRLFGIPVIAKSALGGKGADLEVIGSRKYFGPWGRAFLLRTIDCFIATTPTIEQDLALWRVPRSKIGVIPNGVISQGGRPALSPELRARRCLFLGRIDRDKNILALAEAACEVTRNEDLSLDIFGTGVELSKLRALLAREAGHRVRVMNWHSNPAEILGEYGYLLLPSEAEGLSNAMIEAMTCGVVPMTTRVSGCVDHIKPRINGLFLDGPNVEHLRSGLMELAAIGPDEWVQLSQAAQQHAREHFDIDRVVFEYRTLYRRLAAGQSHSA